MTDKEKFEWIKQQLYQIQNYIRDNPDETLSESGINTDIWRVINGYSYNSMDKRIEW
jgi:hypothetical protein